MAELGFAQVFDVVAEGEHFGVEDLMREVEMSGPPYFVGVVILDVTVVARAPRRRYLTFSAAWVRIRSTVHVTRTIRLTTAGGQVPPAESLLHSEGVPSP